MYLNKHDYKESEFKNIINFDNLDKIDNDYRIIFIDDGSSDATYEKITMLAEKEEHVCGLHFSRNFGKEAAMSAGLASAEGDCVVVIDCDLQHPPEKIIEILPRVEEVPFDSDRKLMTTVNKDNGKYLVYTKGGIDELLSRCTSYILNGEVKTDLDNYKKNIAIENENMAKEALRVLAVAYKDVDKIPESQNEIENKNNILNK